MNAEDSETKGMITFADFIEYGKRSLGAGEKWCIIHPDGPLHETASDDFTVPVLIICDALGADWDDLVEQGFRLGKIAIPTARALGVRDTGKP